MFVSKKKLAWKLNGCEDAQIGRQMIVGERQIMVLKERQGRCKKGRGGVVLKILADASTLMRSLIHSFTQALTHSLTRFH